MNTNTIRALQLLGRATRFHYCIWDLAGPSNAANRALIMTTLTGVKTPQSKAGVTVIETAFCTAAGVDRFTFPEWAKEQMAGDAEYRAVCKEREERAARLNTAHESAAA